MKGLRHIPVAAVALSIAALQSAASDQVIDEKAWSTFESLLGGDIQAYWTGELRDFVAPYRTQRIKVNAVGIDCDGLAMTIEVWRPEEVHFVYSVTMPLAVSLATQGDDVFLAECDTPDCVKIKLSVITPTGLPDQVRTASIFQIVTKDEIGSRSTRKGSRATRAFLVLRKSCGFQE